MTTLSNYDKQASDFLAKTGATIDIQFLKHAKHFDSDTEPRDIYTVTIKRGNRSYTFNFGSSLNDSGFYYTKGKQKVTIDRKHLNAPNLVSIIKKSDWDFMNNGKSDMIHKPVAPTAYGVLACLQKYDVGEFEDFCSEFGYSADSRQAEKTYKAVKNEYTQLCTLFTDSELEELQEIN